MPNTFEQWKNNLDSQGIGAERKFTPAAEEKLGKLADALSTFSTNLSGDMGDDFELSDKLRDYSEKVTSLIAQSKELSAYKDDDVKNNPDKIRVWEETVNSLNTIGDLLKQNYDEMVDFGAKGQELNADVSLQDFSEGIDALSNIYDIEIDRDLMKAHDTFVTWQGKLLKDNNELAHVDAENAYAPETAVKLREAAAQLDTIRENFAAEYGDGNELCIKLSRFSQDLNTLAQKSQWLADPDNAGDDAYDDNVKAWEKALANTAKLDSFFKNNYEDLLLFGAAGTDAAVKPDTRKLMEGLQELDRIYGVKTDTDFIKNSYNKYSRSRTQRVMYDYAKKYDKNDCDYEAPKPNHADFDKALRVLPDTIKDIHTKYMLSPFELSSPEHKKLGDAAERLRKAFENPDLNYDPDEKIAAIEEAIAMADAYRKKKNEDKGFDLNDEEFDIEESPAYWDMGTTRYNAATRLYNIGQTLRNKAGSQLATASDDLKGALKQDPALKNNGTLLSSLNGLDADLNARRKGGFFSGSSEEHRLLKESVADLKKALSPLKLYDAREQKYEALKRARDQAQYYIDRKREDAGVAPGAAWTGPGSDMGKSRYKAAQKILKLASDEMKVMEAEVRKKITPQNSYRMNNELKADKKGSLVRDAYQSQYRGLENTVNNNVEELRGSGFIKYLPGGWDIREHIRAMDEENFGNVTAESPVGLKVGAFLSALNSLDHVKTEAAEPDNAFKHPEWTKEQMKNADRYESKSESYYIGIWNKKKETAEELGEMLADKESMEQILLAFEKAEAESEDYKDHTDKFLEAVDAANEKFKLELDDKIADARKICQDFKERRIQLSQAHEKRLEDWKEAFPCKADEIEDYEIEDQADIDRINEMDKVRKAVKAIASGSLAVKVGEETDFETENTFSEVSQNLKELWRTGDNFEGDDGAEKWKKLGTAVDDLKIFLNTGDNYAKLMIAADKAEKELDDDAEHLDLQDSIDTVIRGLNKYLDAGIDLEALEIKADEYNKAHQPVKNNAGNGLDESMLSEDAPVNRAFDNGEQAVYDDDMFDADEPENKADKGSKDKIEKEIDELDGEKLVDDNSSEMSDKEDNKSELSNEEDNKSELGENDEEPENINEPEEDEDDYELVDTEAKIKEAQDSIRAKTGNAINKPSLEAIDDELRTIAAINIAKLRGPRLVNYDFKRGKESVADMSAYKDMKKIADPDKVIQAATSGSGGLLLETMKNAKDKMSDLEKNGGNRTKPTLTNDLKKGMKP